MLLQSLFPSSTLQYHFEAIQPVRALLLGSFCNQSRTWAVEYNNYTCIHETVEYLLFYIHETVEYLLHCIHETIILSDAFKMRRDYLNTSYLNQKYLPSETMEM